MAQFFFVEWLALWLHETPHFEFEWDQANSTKSLLKHGVSIQQVEEVFYTGKAVPIGKQVLPPVTEERLAIVGPAFSGKMLSVVFTLRNGRVRAISSRPAHRKERDIYEALRQVP